MRLIDSGYTDGSSYPHITADRWTGPFSNNSATFRAVAGKTYTVKPSAGGGWPCTWVALCTTTDEVIGREYATAEEAQAACEFAAQ